jgi:putative endonuclease
MWFRKCKAGDSARALGPWGEKQAERHLKKRGFRLLERNFRCQSGEIDLIMLDQGQTLVFVEVKTRAGEAFSAVESVITQAKKTRMIRAARHFLATHSIQDRPLRFDVVCVIRGQGPRPEIRYYGNAFVP